MRDAADRREARRFTMNLPLRIFPRKNQNPELVAQTKDVSYQGISFSPKPIFSLAAKSNSLFTLSSTDYTIGLRLIFAAKAKYSR